METSFQLMTDMTYDMFYYVKFAALSINPAERALLELH